ncbi:hypothetical protein BDR26DRAFT_861222, partial [Obelidium mucronatum]
MTKGKKSKTKTSKHSANSIEAQLQTFGLELFDVSGDGNCLFRSLSHQLDHTQNNHAKYRADIVKHMKLNKDLYAPFLDEDETIDQRLRRMEKPGIVAFSRAFKVGVVIHQIGQPVWVAGAEDRAIIHIVYHSWEHYSSVIPSTNRASESASTSASNKGSVKELPLSIKERLVVSSIPKHLDTPSVETVRRLLKEYNDDIGAVVEAFVAQVYAVDYDNENDSAGLGKPLESHNGNTEVNIDIIPSELNIEVSELKSLEEPEPSIPKKKDKKPSAKELRALKKKAQKENSL